MKARCNDKNRRDYKWYGGKGIKVCNEWQDFIPFRDWALENGYTEILALEIDRKDNAEDYKPENCRWVLEDEQYKNRTDNTFLTWYGITRNICEWERITGIKRQIIYRRLKRGWDINKALTEPLKKKNSEKKRES
jgi:hypothetical protein